MPSARRSRSGHRSRSARSRGARAAVRTLPPAERRQFSRSRDRCCACLPRRPGSGSSRRRSGARPSGPSTRWISEKTASLSGIRSMTPFEMTTSKLSSANGSALDLALDELDVRDAALRGRRARLCEHLRSHVDACDVALRARPSARRRASRCLRLSRGRAPVRRARARPSENGFATPAKDAPPPSGTRASRSGG